MTSMTRTLVPTRPTLLHVALLALGAGEGEPMRRRVYALVAEHPGLHQRDIARRLDVRPGHAEYHLRQLTRAGLLRAVQEGGYVRYFVQAQPIRPLPAGAVGEADKRWLALLRQARPLAIVANLLHESPQPMGDLARRVGIAPGTLTYQVKKLERVGLVARHQEGNLRLVRLLDRDRVVRVLLAYEPPDDLIAGFEDLWEDVGF